VVWLPLLRATRRVPLHPLSRSTVRLSCLLGPRVRDPVPLARDRCHSGCPEEAWTAVSPGELLTELPQVIGMAELKDLPALVGQLVEAEERARLRLRTTLDPTGPEYTAESPEERLLTIPEAAQVLGVSEDYLYALARQRKIPTVRLPGLDKGGRTRQGKYIRLRQSVLLAWLAELEDKGLDKTINVTLTSACEGRRSKANSQTARTYPGPVRKTRWGTSREREPLGNGRNGHQADCREAHAIAGEVIGEE
jgi:excisionase family DNA binding protein